MPEPATERPDNRSTKDEHGGPPSTAESERSAGEPRTLERSDEPRARRHDPDDVGPKELRDTPKVG